MRPGASLILAAMVALACRRNDPPPSAPSGDSGPHDTGAQDTADTSPPTDPQEIAAGIYALDGIDPALGTDDLAPFLDAVGDSTFVGLGESIHTSQGFSQAKLRLIEALIEEDGFRTVGFETPWDDALMAGAYVETCKGSVDDALRSLFTVWQNSAVLELLEWMCGWNQTHPDDPVVFWGWDTQQGWDDGRRIREFLELAAKGGAIDPMDASAFEDGFSTCAGATSLDATAFFRTSEATEPLDPKRYSACIAGLDSLDAYVAVNQADLEAATSPDAVAWAHISLVGLRAWEELLWASFDDCPAAYEVRDVANAEVLQQLHHLRFPDKKSVIWAHNVHLAADRAAQHGYYGNADLEPYCQGWHGMGGFLEEQLGDDYTAFALSGYDVEYDFFAGDAQLTIPFDPDSIEVQLHALSVPYAFADFAPADGESSFGKGEQEIAGEWMVPADQFRGLIYLDESTAMTWVEADTASGPCGKGRIELSGRVLDYDLLPIEGAEVCELGGECTNAAADGTYVLCATSDSDIALTFGADGFCGQLYNISTPSFTYSLGDFWLGTDDYNEAFYAGTTIPYPPLSGTGNASGYILAADYTNLAGATITLSPTTGEGPLYCDPDYVFDTDLNATSTSGYFGFGALKPGEYEVWVDDGAGTPCWSTSGLNEGTVGGSARVDVVEGFETYIYIRCAI